jgi:hypothetical protein
MQDEYGVIQMSDMVLEQILELAKQLTPEENQELIDHLQSRIPHQFSGMVTRETLLAEHERLKSVGAFDNVESLYGKFGRPGVDISEEELNATIREIRDQWKEDFEEFADDNS